MTSFCPDVPGMRAKIAGGPKTIDIDLLESLAADLILANQEENDRQQVEKMISAGLPVWLSFPKTVAETARFVLDLARRLGTARALRIAKELNAKVSHIASGHGSWRYFCPVWQDHYRNELYWITQNGQTYASDLLAYFGGINAFSSRKRLYPLAAEFDPSLAQDAGSRDQRYPRVSVDEVLLADPQVILLPDEPFPFGDAHLKELLTALDQVTAVRLGNVIRFDGRLIHWCGTTLRESIQKLPGILAGIKEENNDKTGT